MQSNYFKLITNSIIVSTIIFISINSHAESINDEAKTSADKSQSTDKNYSYIIDKKDLSLLFDKIKGVMEEMSKSLEAMSADEEPKEEAPPE